MDNVVISSETFGGYSITIQFDEPQSGGCSLSAQVFLHGIEIGNVPWKELSNPCDKDSAAGVIEFLGLDQFIDRMENVEQYKYALNDLAWRISTNKQLP